MSRHAYGSTRQGRALAGVVDPRPRPTAMLEVARSRQPTTAITDTAQFVLGATCFLGTAPATDIALVTDLSVHVVRRALADLRELRLVSCDRVRGTGTGNVWSAR